MKVHNYTSIYIFSLKISERIADLEEILSEKSNFSTKHTDMNKVDTATLGPQVFTGK